MDQAKFAQSTRDTFELVRAIYERDNLKAKTVIRRIFVKGDEDAQLRHYLALRSLTLALLGFIDETSKQCQGPNGEVLSNGQDILDQLFGQAQRDVDAVENDIDPDLLRAFDSWDDADGSLG